MFKNAKIYDAKGYLMASGVEVAFHENTVSIGHCDYLLENLDVNRATQTITNGSWICLY